jgi:hypothetical protein
MSQQNYWRVKIKGGDLRAIGLSDSQIKSVIEASLSLADTPGL